MRDTGILNGSHGLRVAVLVNDFGAINIDTELIIGVEDNAISLANGCVCCQIRDDLVETIEEVITRPEQPEYILLEASGVADPFVTQPATGCARFDMQRSDAGLRVDVFTDRMIAFYREGTTGANYPTLAYVDLPGGTVHLTQTTDYPWSGLVELVVEVDGRDVEQLSRSSAELIDRCRQGQGPAMLWCRVDRLCSHTNADDHRVYRSDGELELAAGRDPITNLAG